MLAHVLLGPTLSPEPTLLKALRASQVEASAAAPPGVQVETAGEALAAHSVLAGITIRYPEASGMFGGLSTVSWLIVGLSLVCGFVLRGPLNVDF
jgi:hypothetical protein